MIATALMKLEQLQDNNAPPSHAMHLPRFHRRLRTKSLAICQNRQSTNTSHTQTCTKLTLAQLPLIDIPQLIHTRCLTRRNALRKLHEPTNRRLLARGILRRDGINLNRTNPRVVRSAIVLAVAEITDPRLQRGAVVLMDELAVGDDLGLAGDGGPFAGRLEEGEVDFGVFFEVVCFAGFGIGVEDQVDAVAFLV